MEFRVKLATPSPDVDAIDKALRAADPAAIVDLDPADRTLRVTAWMQAGELALLLTRAGYPVSPHDVRPKPSVCCGGCSG